MNEYFDWRALLRKRRREQKISYPALARSTGLSMSIIKAYERGVRRPSLSALEALIDALGLPREEANQWRAGAGFGVAWSSLLTDRYRSDSRYLAALVEGCPWPAFVANQSFDLVHANRAFQRVWNVDLSEPSEPGGRNFLAGIGGGKFLKYAENWEQLLALMIGLMKGDPRVEQNPENPAPWTRLPLEGFLGGAPSLIPALLELWANTEPIAHHIRHHYEVRWRYRGKRLMRFQGVVTPADIWNELSWNDWIPADTETWQMLTEITSPRAAT